MAYRAFVLCVLCVFVGRLLVVHTVIVVSALSFTRVSIFVLYNCRF